MLARLRICSLTKINTPPDADEIEVALLGRGHGESVVIHALDGTWIVIDSLKYENRDAAPLAYLTQMGVGPEAIRVVMATHWHDDHVAGLAQVYSVATNADLVLPLAMTTQEFRAFASIAVGKDMGQLSSGLTEMSDLAAVRKSQARPAPIRAQASMQIFRERSSFGHQICLTAVSPSAADVEDFLAAISAPHIGSPLVGRLMPKNPNDISTACILSMGDENVLLGADLEVGGRPERGWQAVLTARLNSDPRASVFKIPHHGSENAHHDSVWSEMLNEEPVCILAPYNRGRGVPKKADADRIQALTSHAYITTQSPFRKYRGVSSYVEKSLESSGIRAQSLPREVGVIRLRKRISDAKWNVTNFGGAVHLSQFVARD
ncbi:MBL fold metallo-hydrolase [Brevundimonas sp. PAMC22021]|uniref:MBL fold metallo-hydrolase n=1 Tax=Brevundimonas sp. PAMC22021 TaxID=2861285 RepID=UPI001C6387E9|nr:MBL fold metallo-hydrolase [Brevundimonas sp. PAMC22021]